MTLYWVGHGREVPNCPSRHCLGECVTIIELRGVLQEKAVLTIELRAVFGEIAEIVV